MWLQKTSGEIPLWHQEAVYTAVFNCCKMKLNLSMRKQPNQGNPPWPSPTVGNLLLLQFQSQCYCCKYHSSFGNDAGGARYPTGEQPHSSFSPLAHRGSKCSSTPIITRRWRYLPKVTPKGSRELSREPSREPSSLLKIITLFSFH